MSEVKKRSVVQSVLDFIILGIGVKCLGFIRTILMASQYGISADTDAFYFVQAFIFTLASISGQAFQIVLIPILNKAENEGGPEKKKATLSNILNVILLISLAICVLTFIFANPLMTLLLQDNNSPAYRDQVVHFFRLGVPAILFYNAASTLRSYLQSEMLFRESSLSLLPLNLVYIVYILALGQRFGVEGLMAAMVLGIALQLCVQYPSIKKLGFHHHFHIQWDDPLLRRAMTMILPILVGVLALEFNTMIDKVLAFTLPTGAVSALELGRGFSNSARLLFLSAVTTVMYPLISKSAQSQDFPRLRQQIQKAGRYISLMAIPMTAFIVVFALPIIQAVYQRGAFGLQESILSAQALRWYAFAILWTSLVELYQQVFFSMGNTKTPMINSVLLLAANVVFNLLLIGPMQHSGLALGTALAAFVSFLFLLSRLKKDLDFRLGHEELSFFLRLTLPATGAIAASYPLYQVLVKHLPDFTFQLLVIVLIVLLFYVLLTLWLWRLVGLAEVEDLMDMAKKKFSPKRGD